jgi:hypothetical protein
MAGAQGAGGVGVKDNQPMEVDAERSSPTRHLEWVMTLVKSDAGAGCRQQAENRRVLHLIIAA